MSGVVLDTHVLHWWSAEPDKVSKAARTAIESATELGVSGITWYELAWLAEHDRIQVAVPVDSWLSGLSAEVRTLGITPAIARTAAGLPPEFPGDPADRIIYATAVEQGWRLITKDDRMRHHRYPRPVTVW